MLRRDEFTFCGLWKNDWLVEQPHEKLTIRNLRSNILSRVKCGFRFLRNSPQENFTAENTEEKFGKR
jgi:hypothetical protein